MQITDGLKRVAVLCVLKHQNKFLLLKRLKDPFKGHYTPVGGKIDPYEDPYTAALRETKEETGITIPVMQYCGVLIETSPIKYNWISFVYVAEIDFVPPPECNEGTLEWIDFENLLNIPAPKTDWYIYKYLLEAKPFALNALYNKDIELIEMREMINSERLV